MHKGFNMVKTLYDAYFPYDNDAEHLRNMGYMLQLIHNDCNQNFHHCIRVTNYAMMMGNFFDIPAEDKKYLWSAALIHDIGKLYTPKKILQKPDSLTENEFEEIKCHAYNGYYMVKLICENAEISKTILNHHERYDGKGYPGGIRGGEIPFISRILSVADAYDAMTSDRVYKKKLPVKLAFEELRKEREKQFDGRVVDAFLEAFEMNCREVNQLNALGELFE